MNSPPTTEVSSSESGQMDDEKVDETTPDLVLQPEVPNGFELYMLIFSIGLTGFIYSLDVTIIGTVS